MYACKSSSALALVVLSFFKRFLNATTTFGSDMEERSGGSATYDRGEEVEPNADGENPEPNPPPKAPAAALLLLAWGLDCRLLIFDRRSYGEVGGRGRGPENSSERRREGDGKSTVDCPLSGFS